MANEATPSPGSDHYEIRVKGLLDPKWSEWFEGLTVTAVEGGHAILSGPIVDQAALHGLLARIRDLNLALISVRLAEAGRSGSSREADR